jgi:hypothetical protein
MQRKAGCCRHELFAAAITLLDGSESQTDQKALLAGCTTKQFGGSASFQLAA